MSEAERGGASGRDESERLLAGRYRLGGVLGRGGMGTVWRAEDETLGRTVAVKELRFPSSIDEDEKRRLIARTLREAKAIARIRNNGAVTVFDVVDEDDRPWIVMELIEGKSLAEVIREDGLLEPQRAAEVGLAILDVLRAAHREGILHRDVKPSNVLISDDGRVVLTDFGIAQVEGDPSITSTGMLVGAPSYISPERARGHKPGPAADLWSLGGLLYAAVEGVPPYDKGSAIATLTAVMTEPVPEPKSAGPLKDVIFGLLAKDPEQRLDDAGARALLNKVIHASEPGQAEPEPLDATRVVALPPVPEEQSGKRSSGGSGAGAGQKAVGPVAGARTSGWPEVPPPDLPPRPVPRAPITDVVSRRTLIVLVVAVALALLGTVLALALRQDDSGTDAKSAGTGTAASTDVTEGSSEEKGSDTRTDHEKTDAASGSGASASSSPDGKSRGSASGGSGSSGGASDADGIAESTYKGSQGFSIGLPKGWRYQSTDGAGDRFTGPGGQKLLVAWTSTPKNDPVADWKNQERSMVRSKYQRIRIEAVHYRGWKTADWEFTYVKNGTKYRSIDRGFVVSSRQGYALMYTAKASEWHGELRKDTWRTFTKTFEPKR